MNIEKTAPFLLWLIPNLFLVFKRMETYGEVLSGVRNVPSLTVFLGRHSTPSQEKSATGSQLIHVPFP